MLHKSKLSKKFYFLTSPNQCFCTTWQNAKHKNCIFHLNIVWCFVNKHIPIITWSQLHFIHKMIYCMHQTEPRKAAQHPAVCYPHTHPYVSCCVKNGSCSSSQESKSVDSISGIFYYLNKHQLLSNMLQMTILPLSNTATELWPQQPRTELHRLQNLQSHSASQQD